MFRFCLVTLRVKLQIDEERNQETHFNSTHRGIEKKYTHQAPPSECSRAEAIIRSL